MASWYENWTVEIPITDEDVADYKRARATRVPHCETYWGSHGCDLLRGHAGQHLCDCTFTDDDGEWIGPQPHKDSPEADDDNGNVGRAPYYGADTEFYGSKPDWAEYIVPTKSPLAHATQRA